MRPCSSVTTWDASLDDGSLCTYPSPFLLYATVCLLCLFVPRLSMHLYMLAYMSSLACSVSFMLQHNEVMDIRSKPTIFPHKHHFLFAFLLVFFLACWLAFMLSSLFAACHVYHVYQLYASFTYSLHPFLPLLVCWFLVFAFACTHME